MKLQTLASTARHLPDRLMHPIRRERLRRHLASVPKLEEIVFVCHGNICRSPYAAQAFAESLPLAVRDRVRVSSAGFIGPGRPAPEEAIDCARKRRVDLSAHCSALISKETVSSADIIVVMEPVQRRELMRRYGADAKVIVLGDLDPLPIRKRLIRDPFGQARYVFDESYERIDRCIDVLLASLQIPPAGGKAGRYRKQRG